MKNRYVDRYVLALALILALSGDTSAQVKLEGTKEAVVGNLNKVAVKIEKGKDLKVQLLKNGVPISDEYIVVKELDDSVAVLLFPPLPKKDQPKSWTYTVVAAVNDGGKTYQAFHVADVNKAAPAPDPVTPVEPDVPAPKLTGFDKDIVDLWATGKDPVSRDRLVTAFTQVKAAVPGLKSFGDFETVVVASVEKNLPERTKLRTIRSRIAAYLVERTGEDPRLWDAATASAVCDEVNAALRRLE